MRIRKTQDYKTIAKLNRTVHQLHVKLYPELFKPYQYDQVEYYMKEMMKNPRFTFLIVENSYREPVGYAWIEIIDQPETYFQYASKSVFVRQFSIEADQEHKGYGSALMIQIIYLAKENGAKQIELDYWAANTNAGQFYQKHGFVQNRIFVSKKL